MRYYYKRPCGCGVMSIDWESRTEYCVCSKCITGYTPPSPEKEITAYVDQHDPPAEMELIVRELKSNTCCVPWCGCNAETLDHRIPYIPGRTSVENLFPMCQEHNSSKGRKDYYIWLNEIKSDPELGR